MKVALLTNFIPPYRKSLYTELDKHLNSLMIFISQEMESNRNWKVDHGNLNVVIQKGIRYKKKWKGEYGYNEQTIVQIPYDTFFRLRKYKPDIILSSELGIRSLLSVIYSRLYKKPLILWLALSEHTEKNKKGLRLILRKIILKSAHAILCNGSSGERYIKSLGVNKKVFFAPYTSDFSIKSNFPDKKKSQVSILFTGQLIKRKGITEMVKAFQLWSAQNIETTIDLVVAGDGPEKDALLTLNQIPNIKLNFLGSVAYKELKNLYNNSDIYLFPTLADEWGVVVNEAMASGLPVIGSKYSQAVEELIVEGENGWLFQPDSLEEFVSVLSKAIDTPIGQLNKMGENGAKTITDYNPANVAKNICAAIDYVSSCQSDEK